MRKWWTKWKEDKKIRILTIVAVLAVIGIGIGLLSKRVVITEEGVALSGHTGPILYYGDAQMIRGKETAVDVKLSDLKGEYPAASFQIEFDKNKLEFLEIRQGNIEIWNKKTGETIIPEWQYNAENANRKGCISTMYLDMTAEDNPITGDNLTADSDVLFRVVFRVKDSCNDGEKLTLTTSQATFAAIEEADSIAIYKENINTPQGEYIVEVE